MTTDNAQTIDAEGLQNVTPTGKPPERRIKDYTAAVGIITHLVHEDVNDRADRVCQQALVDGEPPWLQADLAEAGQDYRTNVNFLGAAAKSEQNKTPYHTLLNGFDVELAEDVKGTAKLEWQNIVENGWQFLLTRAWPEFQGEYDQIVRLMCDFGVAVANHEHPTDWRIRAGGLGEHLFQRPMRPYENAASIHCCLRDYRVDDLWAWYNNPKASEAGFNKDAIEDALLACNGGQNNGTFGDLRASITNNAYGMAYSKQATVQLFRLRVVELVKQMNADGTEETVKKISECMGRADGAGKDFIYQSKKPMWKESMAECFTLFTAGIGNGELHSIKGLLSKIFDICQAENVHMSLMMDSQSLRSTIPIQAKDANAIQAIQKMSINVGGFTIVPKDANFLQQDWQPLSKDVIPFLQFIGGHRENVSGLYQPMQSPSTVEQTREEIVQRTMQQGVLTADAIIWFYNALERMFNSMRKRICNPKYAKTEPGYRERQMFIDYCTGRGVPEKVVLGMQYVKPRRAVGGGSAGVAMTLLKEAFQSIVPRLDPVGQQTFVQLFGERLLGPDTMKSLMPSLSIVRTTQSQINAMDENRWMEAGTAVPTLPDDDNFLHAQTHDAALPDMAKKEASGETPQPAYLAFLNAFIPHQTAHLAALVGDPRKPQIGDWNKNLNVARQNQQHLVAAAQAEQVRLENQARAQQAKEGSNIVPSGLGSAEAAAHAQKTAAEVQAIQAKAQAGAQAAVQSATIIAQNKAQLQAQAAAQKRAIEDAKHAQEILHNSNQPEEPVPAA